MAHIHEIKDAETHFIIDATTREISNAGVLPALVQGDHNSEVFTFVAPRFVDGHDLSACNKVKVHYLNIDSVTRKPYADIYEVDDLHIDETDTTKVVFTWLISRYSTQNVGLLNFAIEYTCEKDGVIDYSWNTAIFTGVNVKAGINNAAQIMTEYTDILEKWKQDVIKELAQNGNSHEHDNKKTLDKLGERDKTLIYDGKKVVDSSVLAVVEEQKQLESLSDNSLLCYVSTDRIGFTPMTLEAGVVYGGLADYKDRETIYIDPLLQNFFPCSAFTVTTEKVLLNEGGNEYCHYEFSTDGAIYFYFKYFVNDEPFWVRLYNATDDMLIVDDITFPVGWSQYSVGDTEVAEIPIFTDSDYYMYFDVHSLKFSNDDYFNELQNVFSAERTYGSVRGYYQYYNSKWQKINFGRMSIISNSTPLTVDPTLSSEGAAADAKATGDRFAEHYTKQEIDNKGFVTAEYVTAAINGSLDEIEAMIDESGVLDE